MKVVEADGYMNVSLEAATMLDPAGNTLHFDAFTVQNRLIRQVVSISLSVSFIALFLFAHNTWILSEYRPDA